MKCAIFTTGLMLAASTASALYVPREESPRAVSSDDSAAEVAVIHISEIEFARLYDIVEGLNYAELSALHFLTNEALDDVDVPTTVNKRSSRSLEQQFNKFRKFFGGNP